MSSKSSKQKFSFGKLLIWIIVIFVALHIFTDGESTDQLLSLFEDHGSYEPDLKQRQGYLGITIANREDITGAYIAEVKPDSPGADANLLPGDIIIMVGNKPINSNDDFLTEYVSFHAGDSTVFTVLREGQYLTLDIVFGVNPLGETTAPQNTQPQQTLPAGSQPIDTVPPATTPPVDNLPSVPAELRNHVYLNGRNWGYCEKLTGNVVITVLFVSDPDGHWSDEEISTVKNDLQTTVERITSDAARYGAQVSISIQYKAVSISDKIIDADTSKWAESALAAAGLPDRTKMNTVLESTYGADSAPVIFVANHGGRATATSHVSKNEYAVLYEDAHAFYHELSHIFGAKDFYYPDDVKKLTETYLPNSIMVNSSQGVMDDFTAYLIGWTDTLSNNAMTFLQKTAYLTADYLAEEKKKETYTGYVTDFTYDGGSYTGYLVNGVKHGQGKWIRDDGTVWEGTFNHGSFTGTGNIIYSDGGTYEGQWVNSKRHGTGTYKWIDGSSYTGAFVENERTGQGTWTGNTGNTYTGSFLNGSFHGQGTYKWTDGGSYTGGFENGKHSGQGTRIYADGATYVGQWAGGQRNGIGKLTYANGAVYEGSWVDGKRHGKGTYTNANGDTYVGNWDADMRSGEGVLTYANGNVYTGSWSNNTWNGKGTFTWVSGDKYTGEFVDGNRHGYGIYYYPNGNRYEGQWANGDRNGTGTMYYANGTSKSGNWKNNEFVS